MSGTWHHCPGSQNPADITTRGATVVGLHDTFWQNGPRWLIQRESWPLERSSYTEESKKELTVQPVIATPEKEKWCTRFSKWTTVVGVVRTMLSWKYRSLMKFEINRKAEHILFRIIQKECFPEEFRSLTANHKVKRDSKLIQFRPFLGDDGLIRASRRLQLSDLEEDTKHPVILADHVLTVLLFRFIHESNMHLGVEGCVALARRRFATIACRRLFRRIKTRCTVCKRFDGLSGSEVSPPLPVDRVTLQRPFSVVGIDHAGPLVAKISGAHRKVWILLVVCAATGAVNLQLVSSMSAEDVILAFRRFVSRYGTPLLVRSDNGSAFVASSKVLSIEWRFNPPLSPWHGGFYERLVGVVKAPLKRVLKRSLLSYEELQTLLAEVEYLVNDRPITYVGSCDDLALLTPNSLLGSQVGHSGVEERSLSHKKANRRIKYLFELRDNLRKR